MLYLTLFFLSFLTILFIGDFSVKLVKLRKYNQQPLKVFTFDGSDCPYHPSVLFFENGWNGYEYWLAEVPYSPKCKPYMDRNECPSIHVSHDGITWTQLSGLQNPIDNLTEEDVANYDYLSDPHLFCKDNLLECWYRITRRHKEIYDTTDCYLLRKTSKDGVHWSEREILVDLKSEDGDNLNNMVVSPAIIYADGKYRMWYVDSESLTTRNLAYSESVDGHYWSKKVVCSLIGKDSIPWHIDIKEIDGNYYLVNYDYKDISIWDSQDGLEFHYLYTPITPSTIGSFYGNGLYRGSLVFAQGMYSLYFSADDSFHTYIGLMRGKDIKHLEIVSSDSRKFCGFRKFLHDYSTLKYIKYRFIICHFFKTKIIRNMIQ